VRVELVTGDQAVSGGAALAPATPWRAVVDAYLDAKVDSPETRRSYRRHLLDALTDLGVLSVDELTGAALARYRHAVTSSSLSPSSQAQALSALRSFLRWSGTMGAHRLSRDVIAEALSTPRTTVRRPYTVLTDAEIAGMVAAAGNARDRALLAVMLGGGLRVSEAVGLDIADLVEDADGGTVLYVRQGKGRKDRTVPVQPDVAQLVRAYLAATGRRLGDAGPLFAAHDRAAASRAPGRLTAPRAAAAVLRCADAAGIAAKRVSPHVLRHTFAIRALHKGGSVVAVSKLLGHASLTTTQRYVDHLATAELRASIPALPVEAA
jgi:site-specific recombinase XerD